MLRIIGLIIFVASVPLFYILLKRSPSRRSWAWILVGLLPFVIDAWHLDVSIISWPMWPGYVKGALVSILDALALALIAVTRGSVKAKPLLGYYILFFFCSLVATLFSSVMTASLFFSWQLARAIIVFMAVSAIASSPVRIPYIVSGLSLGSLFQALYSINERFHGVTQAGGAMGHQNLLGLCMHFSLFLSMAALLAGSRRGLIWVGLISSIICVVLTGSRATVGLAGGGMVFLIVMSIVRRPTALKMRIASIGALALLVGTPIAIKTLNTRFKDAPSVGGYDERAAFEAAARAMWRDHPMGVGANQYVVVSNAEGYSEKAGVAAISGSRSANVHNTYLLLAAETGYLGLISFLLLFAVSIFSALRLAWSRPRTAPGEISLGLFVLLTVVAIHCLFEWVFVMWVVQYLFAIALGILAGIMKADLLEKRERLRAKRARRLMAGSLQAGTASPKLS